MSVNCIKNGPFGPDQVLDSRYTELYFIFNFWLEAKSFKMQSSKKGSLIKTLTPESREDFDD